jgi:hypothetical protein
MVPTRRGGVPTALSSLVYKPEAVVILVNLHLSPKEPYAV